jgi:hypothetical protein
MFVVRKMAKGEGFLRVLRFSPFTIVQPMLHAHLFIYHRQHVILPNDTEFKQHTANNAFEILVDYWLVRAEPSKEKISAFGSRSGRMLFYKSHNAYQRFTLRH